MNELVITKLSVFSENRIVRVVSVGENGCAKIDKIDDSFRAYNDKDEMIFEAKNVPSYMIESFEKEAVYNESFA